MLTDKVFAYITRQCTKLLVLDGNLWRFVEFLVRDTMLASY